MHPAKETNVMTESPELLTINEFASLLKIKPSCVRRWMRESKITFVHVGRLVRVPKSEVGRIITSGTKRAASGVPK
jgi:excisionase family DNA binding protein